MIRAVGVSGTMLPVLGLTLVRQLSARKGCRSRIWRSNSAVVEPVRATTFQAMALAASGLDGTSQGASA